MKLLYINDLRNLPNFGCRTTGTALQELLSVKNTIVLRDGRETVPNSGWDAYSTEYYKVNGLVPISLYKMAWKNRHNRARVFKYVKQINEATGGLSDFVTGDPALSLQRFDHFKKFTPQLQDFEDRLKECDGLVINGEGTLIFGNPTSRDALYLLFAIALAKRHSKAAYILNAMITGCPYSGTNQTVLNHAIPLLKYCSIIACREEYSYEFVSKLIGETNLVNVPDALFTWGDKIRKASSLVKTLPGLCIPFGSSLSPSDIDFSQPYICVSSSSSAWRNSVDTVKNYNSMVQKIRNMGFNVYLVATCAGDSLLHYMAKDSPAIVIPQEIPAIAGAGIVAGATAYITGRYHPAIMAGANGVPTLFMKSNSHKTKSVQNLLGYENPYEFPTDPTINDIQLIVEKVAEMISQREEISAKVQASFNVQAAKASKYADLIG